MFCSNCGKEIIQGNKFCPMCGNACNMPEQSPIQQEKSTLLSPPPYPNNVTTPNTVKRTPLSNKRFSALRKILKVIWIICNIITIIVLFAGYNIFIRIIQFLYF